MEGILVSFNSDRQDGCLEGTHHIIRTVWGHIESASGSNIGVWFTVVLASTVYGSVWIVILLDSFVTLEIVPSILSVTTVAAIAQVDAVNVLLLGQLVK